MQHQSLWRSQTDVLGRLPLSCILWRQTLCTTNCKEQSTLWLGYLSHVPHHDAAEPSENCCAVCSQFLAVYEIEKIMNSVVTAKIKYLCHKGCSRHECSDVGCYFKNAGADLRSAAEVSCLCISSIGTFSYLAISPIISEDWALFYIN